MHLSAVPGGQGGEHPRTCHARDRSPAGACLTSDVKWGQLRTLIDYSNAKVGQQSFGTAFEQNIVGFDISMNDRRIRRMQLFKRVKYLVSPVENFCDGEWLLS